jgi:hypothetical protein
MEIEIMITMRKLLFGVMFLSLILIYSPCSVLADDTTDDTTTDTTDTTDTDTDSSDGLPNGQDAINYARLASPGSQVYAAAHGEDATPYTIYPIDTGEDYPDLWDRVKQIFLDAFMQFFEDVSGISIPTTTDTSTTTS